MRWSPTSGNAYMCKELDEELKRGEVAAQNLAKHLVAMGAGNLEKIVPVDGVLIKITASIVSNLAGSVEIPTP